MDASQPGEKVQLDCFYVGRLSGTKGTVWQYTAIDVASAYTWAELLAPALDAPVVNLQLPAGLPKLEQTRRRRRT